MKVRTVFPAFMLVLLLAAASIPMATPDATKFPVTMLVYSDGTVEFISESTSSDLGANPGVTSMNARLGIAPTAGGSKLEFTLGIVFTASAIEELSTLLHKLNFGILVYPNGTVALDFLVQFGPGGFPYQLSEWGSEDYVYVTEVAGNMKIVGETTDATLFMKLQPGTTYTRQDMIDSINENTDLVEQQVQMMLTMLGLQITRFQLTPTLYSFNTVLLRVDVGVFGNLTETLSQYMTGTPTQMVFSPLYILGIFAASPDDLSRVTINFTDAGLFDAAVTLNYKQAYDTIINADRMNYLNRIEEIARQDMTNGAPWLPLISVLKPALLDTSLAGFSFNANFDRSTMTWSARSPKMKVGQVSDSTVSLRQFLSSLGPLDEYMTDEFGQAGLTVTMRGVEDARASMSIVIPSGVPTPASRNASSATWEGVYLDQLQDVSFAVHLKDTVPPTITSGIAAGATLSEKRPSLTATFSDNVGIDASTIVVKVDGVDVSSATTKSAAGISYVPTSDLQDGSHTFYVKVQDTAGNPTELTVSFTISSGIPMIYLVGGGAVAVIVLGAVAYFVFLRKPSAAVAGQAQPPPPPPA